MAVPKPPPSEAPAPSHTTQENRNGLVPTSSDVSHTNEPCSRDGTSSLGNTKQPTRSGASSSPVPPPTTSSSRASPLATGPLRAPTPATGSASTSHQTTSSSSTGPSNKTPFGPERPPEASPLSDLMNVLSRLSPADAERFSRQLLSYQSKAFGSINVPFPDFSGSHHNFNGSLPDYDGSFHGFNGAHKASHTTPADLERPLASVLQGAQQGLQQGIRAAAANAGKAMPGPSGTAGKANKAGKTHTASHTPPVSSFDGRPMADPTKDEIRAAIRESFAFSQGLKDASMNMASLNLDSAPVGVSLRAGSSAQAEQGKNSAPRFAEHTLPTSTNQSLFHSPPLAAHHKTSARSDAPQKPKAATAATSSFASSTSPASAFSERTASLIAPDYTSPLASLVHPPPNLPQHLATLRAALLKSMEEDLATQGITPEEQLATFAALEADENNFNMNDVFEAYGVTDGTNDSEKTVPSGTEPYAFSSKSTATHSKNQAGQPSHTPNSNGWKNNAASKTTHTPSYGSYAFAGASGATADHVPGPSPTQHLAVPLQRNSTSPQEAKTPPRSATASPDESTEAANFGIGFMDIPMQYFGPRGRDFNDAPSEAAREPSSAPQKRRRYHIARCIGLPGERFIYPQFGPVAGSKNRPVRTGTAAGHAGACACSACARFSDYRKHYTPGPVAPVHLQCTALNRWGIKCTTAASRSGRGGGTAEKHTNGPPLCDVHAAELSLLRVCAKTARVEPVQAMLREITPKMITKANSLDLLETFLIDLHRTYAELDRALAAQAYAIKHMGVTVETGEADGPDPASGYSIPRGAFATGGVSPGSGGSPIPTTQTTGEADSAAPGAQTPTTTGSGWPAVSHPHTDPSAASLYWAVTSLFVLRAFLISRIALTYDAACALIIDFEDAGWLPLGTNPPRACRFLSTPTLKPPCTPPLAGELQEPDPVAAHAALRRAELLELLSLAGSHATFIEHGQKSIERVRIIECLFRRLVSRDPIVLVRAYRSQHDHVLRFFEDPYCCSSHDLERILYAVQHTDVQTIRDAITDAFRSIAWENSHMEDTEEGAAGMGLQLLGGWIYMVQLPQPLTRLQWDHLYDLCACPECAMQCAYNIEDMLRMRRLMVVDDFRYPGTSQHLYRSATDAASTKPVEPSTEGGSPGMVPPRYAFWADEDESFSEFIFKALCVLKCGEGNESPEYGFGQRIVKRVGLHARCSSSCSVTHSARRGAATPSASPDALTFPWECQTLPTPRYLEVEHRNWILLKFSLTDPNIVAVANALFSRFTVLMTNGQSRDRQVQAGIFSKLPPTEHLWISRYRLAKSRNALKDQPWASGPATIFPENHTSGAANDHLAVYNFVQGLQLKHYDHDLPEFKDVYTILVLEGKSSIHDYERGTYEAFEAKVASAVMMAFGCGSRADVMNLARQRAFQDRDLGPESYYRRDETRSATKNKATRFVSHGVDFDVEVINAQNSKSNNNRLRFTPDQVSGAEQNAKATPETMLSSLRDDHLAFKLSRSLFR